MTTEDQIQLSVDIDTTSVAGTVNLIRTVGRAAVGDKGGAHWKRVGADPGHPGARQSLDGAWWEIAEPVVVVPMIGMYDATAGGAWKHFGA